MRTLFRQRGRLAALAALLGAAVLVATGAMADTPLHPGDSRNSTGTATASWKEAGRGDNVSITYTARAS